MTKQRDLVSCHACKRLTREWRTVALSVDGVSTEWVLCRACSSAAGDALAVTLRDRDPRSASRVWAKYEAGRG